MDLSSVVGLVSVPPLMSQELFVTFVGKPESTVKGWVATRAVPTVKVGGSRLINFERLISDLRSGKAHFQAGDYDDD